MHCILAAIRSTTDVELKENVQLPPPVHHAWLQAYHCSAATYSAKVRLIIIIIETAVPDMRNLHVSCSPDLLQLVCPVAGHAEHQEAWEVL